MWLPPYLGDYEHLLQALLHNPFLGSGHGVPTHHLHSRREGPHPEPWRADISAATASFVAVAAAKAVASELSDKAAGKKILESANAALSQLMDDYCGTPPKRWPWPWPGPPPWIWEIVSELTVAAQSMQEGALSKEVQTIAGQVAQAGVR